MICYWDTSALIPAFIDEIDSEKVMKWFQKHSDSSHFTSWLTFFEFESVLRRKLNQKYITAQQYEKVQESWFLFQSGLNLVPLDSRSARQGLRFQKLYSLKPYDSIQLGSASLLQLEYPEIQFACLDQRLAQIAKQEGFKNLD